MARLVGVDLPREKRVEVALTYIVGVGRTRSKDTLVATVSLGSPRRFFVRRRGGGPSTVVPLGWGDLVVMGGSCQRTHEHAIPKVARAGPRIALMFRPAWEE